ncbi:hypothetical protein PIB30_030897 [Stylosanthes scabra]|uniref:Uncharacterized protein n=1 Tax=Stylosanthes scabra TaxID=79078 RepID=A0ABU6YAE0_9FABA|nr:hypothetical protein [Stylosanthes scabra]
MRSMEKNMKDARSFAVTQFDRHSSEFEVTQISPTACCAHNRVNWATYVHDVYKMSEVFNVYRMSFTPPIPEGFWPPYGGPTLIPYPRMRRAREWRPRSVRIWTNMDEADPSRPRRCGL